MSKHTNTLSRILYFLGVGFLVWTFPCFLVHPMAVNGTQCPVLYTQSRGLCHMLDPWYLY